ncbi:hypothetical protein Tco_0741883 [Tanacetum coccineum]
MFDKLIATPIDFFKFAKTRLKLDKITKEVLVGPVYNLLKGTYQSTIGLEYNMEECYKALSDQLDWKNPEGDRCPFDLSKPLPLKGRPGYLTIPVEYFFNNDLEYLKSENVERKSTTLIDVLSVPDRVEFHVFEARTVSYIVAHVVAIPFGVFLLVASRCIESCTLIEGPVVLFVRKNNRILLSKLKNGHRDANSSDRCELLEKISLDLKGLESYSNTDDLRGNIIEAIRLEIENDVKVENNC